jgi:predicted permease
MSWFRVLHARLFALAHKGQIESEMEEELRFHLAMRAQDNVRSGMTESEARIIAKRQFGNVNLIKDRWRDVIGGGFLETFWHDLRFAFRMLLKDRAFSLIAILALGLGIGANTALFTVVSKVLLHPLPYPNPDELMSITMREDGRMDKSIPLSYPDFADLSGENQWFDGLGAFSTGGFVFSGGNLEAIRAQGTRVTPQIFSLLGVAPILGRIFTEEENDPGNRSVLLSYQLWQEQFAGSSSAVGDTINLDGANYEIIGIMPPGFEFPVENEPAQLWTTFAREREPIPGTDSGITRHRDAHYVAMLGRLKKGVSRETAAAGLSEIAATLAKLYPATNRRLDSCAVVPWLGQITNKVRPALLTLIGAALCVLCVASVNVANLLLARATTRQKEMAIRAALGAGRRRILRQLLTESLLLASLGGCLGSVLAIAGTHYIVSMLPPDFPRSREITLDLQMFVFTGAVSILTSCIFGFAPAWRSARCNLARILNDCSRVAEESPRGRGLRNGLVITELILAFVLLVGALCLTRGLWKLKRVDPGFEVHNLLTVKVSLPHSENDPGSRTAAFYREFLSRLEAAKEIRSVAAVFPLPLTNHAKSDYEVNGRPIAKADLPRGRAYAVTPHYFQTMEIPLVRGRDFDARDRRGAKPVTIVNETFARTVFPNENPLGKLIRPGLADGTAPPFEREIIGVVGDVQGNDLATAPTPEMYLPHPQCAGEEMTLVLRGNGTEESAYAAIQRVLQSIDKNVPLSQSYPMEHYLAAALAQARLNSILMTIFAGVAVTLTAIGVYGVMAYTVVQRRHEIGIRLALGAQKLAVFQLILGEGMRLLGWALFAGGICTIVLTRSFHRLEFGATNNEMITIVSVAVLLSVVGLIACWLPARRAARLDPLTALGQR